MISMTIKKRWLKTKFEAQEKYGNFEEYKSRSSYWETHLRKFFPDHDINRGIIGNYKKGITDMVLLCGREAYLAKVVQVTLIDTPIYVKDVVDTKRCFKISARFYRSSIKDWNRDKYETI